MQMANTQKDYIVSSFHVEQYLEANHIKLDKYYLLRVKFLPF